MMASGQGVQKKKSRYTPRMLPFLLLCDILVILAHVFLRDRLGFFDLDKEGNLVSLYSGAKLWVVATLVFVNAFILTRTRAPRTTRIAWILAGLGIAYIGLDDMMGVHERIGFVLNNALGTGGFYGESFNWLLYFSPFIVAALLVFGVLIRALWRDNRRAAWWFIAGTLMWAGSIGAELLGRYMILQPAVNVIRYHRLIIIEEALELMGATALAMAMWYAVRSTVKRHLHVVV